MCWTCKYGQNLPGALFETSDAAHFRRNTQPSEFVFKGIAVTMWMIQVSSPALQFLYPRCQTSRFRYTCIAFCTPQLSAQHRWQLSDSRWRMCVPTVASNGVNDPSPSMTCFTMRTRVYSNTNQPKLTSMKKTACLAEQTVLHPKQALSIPEHRPLTLQTLCHPSSRSPWCQQEAYDVGRGITTKGH